ncbi:type II toxin-antitoxin system VapC family toxin [Pararhizobium mangrovi]|uniref:Type II toxin-antitoxin system VapC family toxin n=1 Tax=Pararhizobium mangrovi TaxID=2590452 RepID=A0A506UHA6_9HYPH|nr:type II toxin-antitoxin system VapC family toxin [Pararhizobium mangrovi]TPW32691.1 type II toxin-antitoxin system VapC family toxin [Pararhizobium mangrovi]
MVTLVDTNVLIDLAVRDAEWRVWSHARLSSAREHGAIVINPVIYSEFSYRYTDPEEVEAVLDPEAFRREGLPWPAAFAAAQAFRRYREAGGKRDRVLPDFLIGAHAAIRGYDLLTRDTGRYATYFPTVSLITPESHP